MKTILLLLLVILTGSATAQRFAVYRFQNDLNDLNAAYPPLTVLGKKGHFIVDELVDLKNMKKTVYRFYRNAGLSFDNSLADGILSGSYTIEMYFRLDRLDSLKRVLDFKNGKSDAGAYILKGRVNFYRLMIANEMVAGEGEYIHWVISRDASSRKVTVYADGKQQIQFQDFGELAVVDGDNKLNFFFDDLPGSGHTSAGAVAYIKLYDYVITSEEVNKSFNELGYNLQSKSAHVTRDTLPVTTIAPTVERDAVVTESKTLAGMDSLQESNLTEGTKVILQNIQFEPGQFELLPASFAELDKLVLLMQKNPGIDIFLSGHTDSPGNAPENMLLSENRVKAVKTYLENKGIAGTRISGQGFAGTKPVADFNSPESRKKNRRVEFTIIKSRK